jgi:hypothetical protein
MSAGDIVDLVLGNSFRHSFLLLALFPFPFFPLFLAPYRVLVTKSILVPTKFYISLRLPVSRLFK